MTFERAVEFVLKHEGGISDDPQDSGGLTKWGISEAQYPQVRSHEFTKDDAILIYRRDYWQHCKCDEMPWPVALILFDGAVNQGQGAAVRLLQRALNVQADGIVGPQTLAAANSLPLMDVVSEFIARRAFRYAETVNVQRYGLDWFRRLAACHQLAMEPE